MLYLCCDGRNFLPINLSILDFKSLKRGGGSYTRYAINLSILDFKFFSDVIALLILRAINLSILDFKFTLALRCSAISSLEIYPYWILNVRG